MKANIKSLFLTGLLIFVPLAVTLYVLVVGFRFLDSILRPFITTLIGFAGSKFYIPGISLIVLFFLITILGAFARITLGQKLVNAFENLLLKLPLVKGIYSTVKHASSAFLANHSPGFMGVVLVEYPRKGVYVIGLTTAVGVEEIQAKTKQRMINVFIPTSPNPTSGMLLIVPEDEVIKLDMSVDEGLKLVISGGFSNVKNASKEPSTV
jgi:uncharacterized membrane protein